jgi:hypothetical protein
MASGVDGDNEECVEAQRLTGIQFNDSIFQCFVVTKYTTFILLSDAIWR